ncbi:sigma-70 family RNA polymerase sigma factor [Streptomyces acidiscabies]|uniref:sigma-70 family RNA polymerase sigma factor n=1 Tax=Streptomyces acidiscabies TaxID=42234 RepID=UPI00073E3421|nr:sigma-70 family RNA polymerase sigma factor [Streptomyces acidiscabies]GAQ51943.1 ECF RNA polymerase sigma factor SigJ [Streptomyces acidiscabies]
MPDTLATRFEEQRSHLRSVAYRMLGSLSEAEDAVQETWLRLSRQDPAEIRSLPAWLTTVTGRICLDLLNVRTSRREQPIDETFVPDPVITPLLSPEAEAVHADSVGLAMLIVLDTLDPAERLAFVLHDMFAVPFDDIAEIVERPPATTRQLASRARRKVQGATPSAPPDQARQHRVVEAFLTAARIGDFDALLAVLDPDVVLRADSGALVAGRAASKLVRGAAQVAEQALLFREFAPFGRFALVGGEVGIVNVVEGTARSVMGVTVVDDRIVALHILADPERVARLDLPEGIVG